ncbi:hypothetical protein HY256_03700 [Candidatus Sumerlaeota bacterium]|nr:hypothetical protein [Candidatus Sumerlaeota bacterium]
MLEYIQKYIWAHLPKSASRKTLIWSALIWGACLPALAGVFHHFGRFSETTFKVFLIGGGALGVAQLIPGIGEKVYLAILKISALFGYFIFRIGLTIAFYVVVTPMGWFLRMTGKDPLEEQFKSGQPPKWHPHSGKDDPRRYYRLS